MDQEEEEEEDLRSESMDNVAAALGSLEDDEARSRELPMLSPLELTAACAKNPKRHLFPQGMCTVFWTYQHLAYWSVKTRACT